MEDSPSAIGIHSSRSEVTILEKDDIKIEDYELDIKLEDVEQPIRDSGYEECSVEVGKEIRPKANDAVVDPDFVNQNVAGREFKFSSEINSCKIGTVGGDGAGANHPNLENHSGKECLKSSGESSQMSKCIDRGSQIGNENYFMKHIKIQHDAHREHDVNAENFTCDSCSFTTKQKHDVDCEKFVCDICSFTAKQKHYLIQHMKLKHDVNCEIVCDICSFTTKQEQYLMQHMKLRHDVDCEKFVCDICSYATKQKPYLTRHKKVKHDVNAEKFACDICSYTTKWKYDLTQHVRVKHDMNVEIFNCDVCTFSTKYKFYLVKHMKLKHDVDSEVFPGAVCTYTTNQKHNLKGHIKVKHDVNTELLKCGICTFSTKHKTCLIRHIKLKHEGVMGKHAAVPFKFSNSGSLLVKQAVRVLADGIQREPADLKYKEP